MRAVFTFRARTQLQAIHDYIARDNPAAARSVIQRVEVVAQFLAENPCAGFKLSRGKLHRFPVRPYPYLLYYEISERAVQIVRVRHAAQFRKAFHEAPSEFRR